MLRRPLALWMVLPAESQVVRASVGGNSYEFTAERVRPLVVDDTSCCGVDALPVLVLPAATLTGAVILRPRSWSYEQAAGEQLLSVRLADEIAVRELAERKRYRAQGGGPEGWRTSLGQREVEFYAPFDEGSGGPFRASMRVRIVARCPVVVLGTTKRLHQLTQREDLCVQPVNWASVEAPVVVIARPKLLEQAAPSEVRAA